MRSGGLCLFLIDNWKRDEIFLKEQGKWKVAPPQSRLDQIQTECVVAENTDTVLVLSPAQKVNFSSHIKVESNNPGVQTLQHSQQYIH